jgi:DNA invertase Pin-like site-specific DNA recombinase
MFQMLGVFAEFEREMIKERINSGMNRVRNEIERKGRYTTKKGTIIKRFGRPGNEPHKAEHAKELLKAGHGIVKVAKMVGLGAGSVHQLKRELVASS